MASVWLPDVANWDRRGLQQIRVRRGPSLQTDVLGYFSREDELIIERSLLVEGVRWLKLSASAYAVLQARNDAAFIPFDAAVDGWTTTLGSDGRFHP